MFRILNIGDVALESLPPPYAPTGEAAARYAPRLARLAGSLGGPELGANLIALAPGKSAFPFHSHRASDELFYVVSGAGELRYGEHVYPIRAGDFISCPAGGPETAHQIRNTGSLELRYLAVGTNPRMDIVEYPDTGRFKAYSGGDGVPRFDAIARVDPTADYWELPSEK